jgi:hypothetical protein
MNKLIGKIINGKDNKLNGLIALAVVLSIALGCNCGKTFNTDNTTSSSNSTSDNPFAANTSSTNTTTVDRPGETKPNASKGTVPTDGEIQYLVRETMLGFNDALQKEDFTEFYSTISKQWQKQTSAAAMKTSFQSFIDGQANFGEIRSMIAEVEDKKTRKQSGYKVFDVKGKYDTSPIDTTFDLSYVAEGNEWKLFKIQVYTGVKTR